MLDVDKISHRKAISWPAHFAHDDVIKWKHFWRYWPFVRGIHRPPVNSPHKGQWRRALMFSLICVWINNREAGDLRRNRAHYDVIAMLSGSTMGRRWNGWWKMMWVMWVPNISSWKYTHTIKKNVETCLNRFWTRHDKDLRRRRRAIPYFFSTSCYLIRMT